MKGCCDSSKCFIIWGIVLGIFGIILMSCLQVSFDSIVDNTVKLGEDKDIMDMFTTPPVPIYMEFYFFNVTNPLDVQYYGDTPVLHEVGPYVYEELREKFNMDFKNEETTIEYLQNKTYTFRDDLSDGLLDTDQITSVNVLMVMLANMTKAVNGIGLLWPEIEKTMNVFEAHTVAEYLFAGWEMPTYNFNLIVGHTNGTDTNLTLEGDLYHILLDIGVDDDIIPPLIKDNKIGYYNTKNYTDDGVYEVFTGQEDINKFLNVYLYEHEPELSFWKTDYCNMLNGTDGTQFPPSSVSEYGKVGIFITELCRSIYLSYSSESKHFGVDCLRFAAPAELMESPDINEDNACFLTDMHMESGLMEMTPCMHVPIVMSQPHFLDGGGEELKKYEGLSPDREKHQTALDIEPILGLPLEAHKRIQINVPISKFGDLTSFMNFNDMFFPVFWADENAVFTEEETAVVNSILTLPFAIGYSVGALLIVISLVLVFVGYRKKQKSTATV